MSADRHPVSMADNGTMTLRNVGFATTGQGQEIVIENGKITKIKESDAPVAWICMPPLVDKHVHANRAFTLGGKKPESFAHAIALTTALFKDFDTADYCAHARQLFERACSHGTSGIRTHADIDAYTQLKAVQGSLDASEDMGERMDIEVVAFASARLDPASADGRALLRTAVEMGADLIGAVPALYADPKRAIDAVIELALTLDVGIDLHQDEHLNADNISSGYLADALIANGCQGKLTLSHGCALSVLQPAERSRVLDRLAAAEVQVVVLPLTNLYLQDRGTGTPRQRGLTCVHEMLQAGIELRFATDNVCDAFYPYGDADLLDTLYVGMLAAQLDSTELLLKSVCDGRADLSVGDEASLLLIKGSDFDEVLSKRPAERIPIRRGWLPARQ